MQPFPHIYTVAAVANATEDVMVESDGVTPLPTTTPAQFGGSGDLWSPETLLVASIADCFVLTFRAIAAASKCEWISLSCEMDGTLDRVDRQIQFTEYTMRVSLSVPPGADVERARMLLEKSDAKCLVTNSLKGSVRMEADVVVQSESENMA